LSFSLTFFLSFAFLFLFFLWWDLLLGARKGFEECVCVWNFYLEQKRGSKSECVCVCWEF
jgi:hypothetical protein